MKTNFLTSSTLECKSVLDNVNLCLVGAVIIDILVASANFLEPRCFGSGARLFAMRGNPS